MNTAAAHAGSAERARIGAIAQIQLRHIGFLRSRHRNRRFRRVCAGEAVAIQAQMQNRPPTDRQVGRHIARQIDISNLVPERSGGADRNPFPFIGNLALAVPRLPFHVLMGVIERTAADAVVGVGRDSDGNRRRGRRRIVVGFRGIGVKLIVARRSEGKVRVNRGVGLRSGRLAKHLIIRHGRLFLHALHRENRQDLLTNADGILGQLQRHALRRLLSPHRQYQLGGDAVAIHRRHADDGALTGADGFQRQRGCCGKRRIGVVLVIPAIGRGCAAVAVHVGCSSSQSDGVILVRRQCIAAVPTGDIASGDRQRRQRRVGHDHVLDDALRRLLRTEPLASRRATVAELRGTLPVQERTHCATFASVGDVAVGAAAAFEHQLAGIAAQIADGAVVDNGDNAVFRVLNLDVGGRYARLDFYCAGLIERDGIRIICIDCQLCAIRQCGQRFAHGIVPHHARVCLDARGGLPAANLADTVGTILVRCKRRVGFNRRKFGCSLLIAEVPSAAFAVPVFHCTLGNTGGVFCGDMLQIMSGRRKIHFVLCKFITGHIRMQEEIPAAGAFPAARVIIVLGAEVDILLMKYRLINPLIRCQRKGNRETLGAAGRKGCRNRRRKGLADLLVAELRICIYEGMCSAVGKERIVAAV